MDSDSFIFRFSNSLWIEVLLLLPCYHLETLAAEFPSQACFAVVALIILGKTVEETPFCSFERALASIILFAQVSPFLPLKVDSHQQVH